MALPGNLTATRGPRDDASIVPYRGLRHGKVAVSRFGTGLPSIVGAGFIPPGDLPVPQGPRDDASIVPYRGLRHDKVAVSRLGTGLPLIVGAGFIPPAGVCPAAGCGGMRASRPTAAWVVTAVPVWSGA